ncbi:hypothetical protein SELMODRAFT_151109 [Selaginella moellendorffii]|uniref:beta-glucosidase n=1 Tax=Selaginella moellendorffii TaxID=88036 RepID=D8RYS2_SELML|nr:beta-glucosidase 7 [Selaginella moellendorffii]EFJ22622.1 hypothetical protein SELMODRAFT_151109 [Selaginella moellendorffii]|eukprot:XP_002976362.1 beta-glucosidase 7 [Selaginella moellendorffii]
MTSCSMVSLCSLRVASCGIASPAAQKLNTGISRLSFPKDFIFGTSSAAAQYEGAAAEGGRKPSIWDHWCTLPDKIDDGSNPSITMDQYHRYKEDVRLLSDLGVNAYRFSISWTRLFPDGRVNPEGLAYYNSLINSLLEHGIKPFITIYHWDLPQALQESMGGWTNKEIVDKYVEFADICFAAFGDRVKHWITFNEPCHSLKYCYAEGIWPPGVKSDTEVYIAGHNTLLAHAAAVKRYREKYQAKQGGKIGISLDGFWYEPVYQIPQDVAASYRALDFNLGWFLSPVVYGYYPETMRANVGGRLPHFTEEEARNLMGSIDFLGLNYYTSMYVKDSPSDIWQPAGYNTDMRAKTLFDVDGIPIGPKAYETSWLSIVPWGFYKLLNYIKKEYNNPTIFVTENGFNQVHAPYKDSMDDNERIQYLTGHYTNMAQAIRDGADVQGHFIWSFLDCWEWKSGYTNHFGLFYVDRNTQDRLPKKSAYWVKNFLKPDRGLILPSATPPLVQPLGKNVALAPAQAVQAF